MPSSPARRVSNRSPSPTWARPCSGSTPSSAGSMTSGRTWRSSDAPSGCSAAAITRSAARSPRPAKELEAAQAELRAPDRSAVCPTARSPSRWWRSEPRSRRRASSSTGRWFTGTAARRAAVADGVAADPITVPHRRYFRSREGRLAHDGRSPRPPPSPFGVGAPAWALDDLDRGLRADRPLGSTLGGPRSRHDPFWITVPNGTSPGAAAALPIGRIGSSACLAGRGPVALR